ncbi:PqqD family peptide modification chaperone [Corallococcus sp. 4LFB]|uniref:PqqD family peptide modification chaperone n=2 Tax=Corallococcus TaxID=83461 RepID=UPI0039772004
MAGDSMWPSLRAGDVAEVEPLVEAPRPGEVVLARFESSLVLHRVRWCDGSFCALRGDNGGAEDPPLPLFRILGRARRVRRGGALLDVERWDVGPRRVGRWRADGEAPGGRVVGKDGPRMSFQEGSVPRRRAGTSGEGFGADFLVLDAEGRTLRGLNPTAARIWALCDGQRTARAVAEQVAAEFSTDVGPVLTDTLRFLAELQRRGLLDEVRAPAGAAPLEDT